MKKLLVITTIFLGSIAVTNAQPPLPPHPAIAGHHPQLPPHPPLPPHPHRSHVVHRHTVRHHYKHHKPIRHHHYKHKKYSFISFPRTTAYNV